MERERDRGRQRERERGRESSNVDSMEENRGSIGSIFIMWLHSSIHLH